MMSRTTIFSVAVLFSGFSCASESATTSEGEIAREFLSGYVDIAHTTDNESGYHYYVPGNMLSKSPAGIYGLVHDTPDMLTYVGLMFFSANPKGSNQFSIYGMPSIIATDFVCDTTLINTSRIGETKKCPMIQIMRSGQLKDDLPVLAKKIEELNKNRFSSKAQHNTD